jgi:hypothetical protein
MAQTSGPLFDHTADLLAEQMCQEIEVEVGDAGAELIVARLGEVLQHKTGFYQSHIAARPDGRDVKITDQGIVYGPWLEGTGSRNRTTRFKGYATFRRSVQDIRRRAEGISERVSAAYVRRMG